MEHAVAPAASIQAAPTHNGAGLLCTYRAFCSFRRRFACSSQSEKSAQEIAFAKLVEMNPKINDEKWQRERRREFEEFKKEKEQVDKEEAEKTENYRKISKRMDGFDPEDIKKARQLVANFIRAGEDVEKKIQEAAEKGQLTKLVLLVIYNRLELARHDDQRHVIQALDLLYRRIEAEILRIEATPAIQYLDELLNLQEDTSHEDWLRLCRQSMLATFPREDAFSILAPLDFDLQNYKGPIDAPIEDDVLLRVDFIRDVDALLAEIERPQQTLEPFENLDPLSVAIQLTQQQKERAIQQVRDLLQLAIELKW